MKPNDTKDSSSLLTREEGLPMVYEETNNEENLTEEEWQSIQRGMEDILNGRTYRILPGESLDEFTCRLKEECQ